MWWGWWLTLGWLAGSIYGVWVTRWQLRRRERNRRLSRREMRKLKDRFIAAQSSPTDTLWFGAPDHPGRGGLPLADPEVRHNPLGLSLEQQRQSDISSMIDAVFGNSLSCTLRCTFGAWCWREPGHAGSCSYFHVPDSVDTP